MLSEPVTFNVILGSLLIMAGPGLLVWSNRNLNQKAADPGTPRLSAKGLIAGLFAGLCFGTSPLMIKWGEDYEKLHPDVKFDISAGGAGKVTEYDVSGVGTMPWRIAPGPDGALWFTVQGADNVGRITTSGAVSTFAIPQGVPGFGHTNGMTEGPDGAMWFT